MLRYIPKRYNDIRLGLRFTRCQFHNDGAAAQPLAQDDGVFAPRRVDHVDDVYVIGGFGFGNLDNLVVGACSFSASVRILESLAITGSGVALRRSLI